MRRLVRRGLGLAGLFLEAADAPMLVGFDNAELLRGFRGGNLQCGHSDVGAGIEMLLEHLGVIHFVDVVAGENEGELGAFAADGVDVLVDGVGGAHVPVFADPLHGRQDFDKLAQLTAHDVAPAFTDMAVERERLVLRQDVDAAQIGVEAVGERDVDDAVDAAEGDGRLGAVARERIQTLTRSSRQQDSESVYH